MKAGDGGEVSKCTYTPVPFSAAGERFFSKPRIFLLMMIVDSLLLGQSASGRNFCDDSGRNPLAD
jgi:hypothetical protein